MHGFKVNCKSEKAAKDLAFGLRARAPRITEAEDARFGIKVRVEGRKVLVVALPKHPSP
jgi:hypothetical protein